MAFLADGRSLYFLLPFLDVLGLKQHQSDISVGCSGIMRNVRTSAVFRKTGTNKIHVELETWPNYIIALLSQSSRSSRDDRKCEIILRWIAETTEKTQNIKHFIVSSDMIYSYS